MGILSYFTSKREIQLQNELNNMTSQRDTLLEQIADFTDEVNKLKKNNNKLHNENSELKTENASLFDFKYDIIELVKKNMDNKDIVELEGVDENQLVKDFEAALNSSQSNCRGGCQVRKPNSNKVTSETFSSRTEAEELLKKFKAKTLILVA